MVLKVSGKNAKLNAALRGAARGLPTGLALGQRSRSLDQDQERQRFYQDQVIRQAKLAADELEREEGYRRATGEAVAETAKPISSGASGPFGKGAPGVLGKVQRSANMASGDMAALDRVGKIAQKMDPRYALDFVRMMQEKHAKLVDERERKTLTDEIADWMSGSSGFTMQPDDSLVSSKDTEDATGKMIESLGKKAPTEQVKVDFANLRHKQANDRAAKKHLKATLQDFDQQIETIRTTRSGGPGNEGSMAGGILQDKRLKQLREEYEQFSPQFLRDPTSKESQEFLARFSKQWSNAKNGIAVDDPDFGPVTFEALPLYQRAKLKINEAKESADVELSKARADRLRDEMANPGKYKKPTPGTTNKPLSMKEALDTARATLEKGPEPVTIEAVYHEARRLITAEREARKVDAEADGASGEATAQEVTPEQAAALGWSDEDWMEYEKTGAVPK